MKPTRIGPGTGSWNDDDGLRNAGDGRQPTRDLQSESEDEQRAANRMADTVSAISELDDAELPQTD
jgi:hypothetical protein